MKAVSSGGDNPFWAPRLRNFAGIERPRIRRSSGGWEKPVESGSMLALLARFPLEIHAWTVPLTFATGWVIGYAHFRNSLHRKHPDLHREWRQRTHPEDPPGSNDRQED